MRSIRSSLDLFCIYDASDSMLNCQLDIFSPTSIAELLKVVRTVESKSCSFILNLLFLKKKKYFDMPPPTLCVIVKLFLEHGHLPASLKSTVLSPLLKKPSLDHEVLGNYRPTSKLNVISRHREGVAYSSRSHP